MAGDTRCWECPALRPLSSTQRARYGGWWMYNVCGFVYSLLSCHCSEVYLVVYGSGDFPLLQWNCSIWDSQVSWLKEVSSFQKCPSREVALHVHVDAPTAHHNALPCTCVHVYNINTHACTHSQAPYLLLVEIVECEDTFLSPLPAKQLDVTVKSAGL